MKSQVSKTWHALGTTGKLVILLTVFFFIGKSLGNR